MLPAPGSAGLVPVSSSTSAGSWTQVGAAGIASDAITEAKLDVLDSPADNEVLTYDSASGRMEWTAGIPSGLIAAFATAAAIATGWTRYSAADGRILVGAGTTFGVTYVENTAYGTSWSHSHSTGDHEHSAAALGVSGSTGAPDSTKNVTGGGSSSVPQETHTHTSGSIDVTGYTDAMKELGTHASTAIPTSSDAWVIPSYAIVWAKKD